MTLISASTDTGYYTGPTTNQVPLNPETALFMLKSLLKTAGWTIAACGTGTGGTAASGSTDLLSSSLIMTGARNWWCARRPAASQSFTFQKDATAVTSVSWRIKYSPGGFATSGTQTNNQTPGPVTGSEEIILVGGGTDASPTFGSAFPGVSSIYRTNMLADNNSPHGWWLAQWTLGGAATATNAMVFDPMLPNSYDPLDQDPYIMHFRVTNPFQATSINSPLNGPLGYYRRGLTGATGSIFSGLRYQDTLNTIIPCGVPTNPYSNKEEVFLIPYGRALSIGAWSGWKGFGSMMRWLGQNHICGDTLNINSTRDFIAIGQCALSWSTEVAAT